MLNGVDICAILFVLIHVIVSWRRGLAEEIGRLVGAILAFWIGLRYHERVAGWMMDHTRMEGASANVVSYITVVVAIILASLILTLVVSKIIELAIPESINKLGGGLAGLFKGMLYAAMIVLIMNMWPHDYLNRQFGEESAIGSVVMQWAPLVREKLEEEGVGERVRASVERSREQAEALLESDEATKGVGRVRQWFSKEE